MKKILMQCALIALPFLASAQNSPNLYSDFQKGINNISSVKINDKLQVIVSAVDHDNFNLIAMNDQMQTVWQTALKGNVITAGKFKDEIVVVTTTDYAAMKGGPNNTYKAFAINPPDGKVLTEKIIYQDSDDYLEFPTFFFDKQNSSYFKMAVRQSALERRMHGSFGPLVLLAINKINKQGHTTKALTAIEYNERLETVKSFTPDIASDYVFGMNCSKLGNLMITGYDGNATVEVYKYNFGDAKPLAHMSQTVDIRNTDASSLDGTYSSAASAADNNILYFGLLTKNSEKDNQLNIIKFDFNAQKQQLVTEVFDKQHVKTLEKNFKTVNKDCDDPNIGGTKNLSIRYMEEDGAHLITAFSNRFTSSSGTSVSFNEKANIINIYDLGLNLKAQQLLPVGYSTNLDYLPIGYYVNHNKLYVVGNFKSGMLTIKGIYGAMNLASGEWDKMEVLSKKKIANTSFAEGTSVLWYGDNYIVPYLDKKLFSFRSYNVDLQQNIL